MVSSPSNPAAKPSRFSYESFIVLRAAACALPGVAVTIALLIAQEAEWELWLTALTIVLLPFPFLAWRLQTWITNPIRVAVNVISSIREGDFTLRGRRVAEASGTIVDLYREINDLAGVMEQQRISGIETRTAVDKITANIDVATLIVDSNRRVVQANEAARRLIDSINRWEIDPVSRTVDELDIAFCIDISRADFSSFSFINDGRRFEGRRGIFRMDGERFDLVVLTDITKAANEQERESWKRLLRVLGHELNNSIAPIHSLANTLSKMVRATEMDAESKNDLLESLGAISSRSESIIRFMQDYTRLAKLPDPVLDTVELGALVRKASQLFSGVVALDDCSEEVVVTADACQLEQALINLMKNAAEASTHRENSVNCRCVQSGGFVEIQIRDTGPGIANAENLFVPFYTTKEKGSGIGLAISKQIIAAVGGTLSLHNRADAQGCIATIQLPLSGQRA